MTDILGVVLRNRMPHYCGLTYRVASMPKSRRQDASKQRRRGPSGSCGYAWNDQTFIHAIPVHIRIRITDRTKPWGLRICDVTVDMREAWHELPVDANTEVLLIALPAADPPLSGGITPKPATEIDLTHCSTTAVTAGPNDLGR